MKIKPETKIIDLIEEYPELAEILMLDYGLHCVNCIFSGFDTIEAGARIHGIEGKDLDDMIKDLEKAINNERD
jgi:hybrid cluster-associated redox disulfide protein